MERYAEAELKTDISVIIDEPVDEQVEEQVEDEGYEDTTLGWAETDHLL